MTTLTFKSVGDDWNDADWIEWGVDAGAERYEYIPEGTGVFDLYVADGDGKKWLTNADGGMVMVVERGATHTVTSEYAGWYWKYELDPGVYPVTLKRNRGRGYGGQMMQDVVTEPAIADWGVVEVPGTLIAGDEQSRFGGARIGSDPIREKIGRKETVSIVLWDKTVRAAGTAIANGEGRDD